jgi:excisionase family DNA binding protein
MDTPELPAAQFSISLPLEFYQDLDARIKKAVSEAISGNPDQSTNKVRYLTRREVCALLNISLPTLSRYVNKGLLKAQRIGTRILFDEDVLKESLQDLPVKFNNQ